MKKILITSSLFIILLFLALSVPKVYAVPTNSLNESTSQNNINTNSASNTTNIVSNTSTNTANVISQNSVNTVSKKTNTDQQNTTSTATTQNTSFDSDDGDSFGLGNLILRSVLFGFIVATVFCVIVWLKHKPVHIAKNANKYLDTSTVTITKSYDHYIRSNTERKAIYKNN